MLDGELGQDPPLDVGQLLFESGVAARLNEHLFIFLGRINGGVVQALTVNLPFITAVRDDGDRVTTASQRSANPGHLADVAPGAVDKNYDGCHLHSFRVNPRAPHRFAKVRRTWVDDT